MLLKHNVDRVEPGPSSLSEKSLKVIWDADALRTDLRGFLYKCLLQIRVYPENPRPMFLSPTGC